MFGMQTDDTHDGSNMELEYHEEDPNDLEGIRPLFRYLWISFCEFSENVRFSKNTTDDKM